MTDDIDVAGSEEFSGQKVRLYPVTRIQGRADIEVLFTPQQGVREARFRALESRGIQSLVRGMPALRAPQLLSRICGTCGPFHQLASCMAIEAACGAEVPPEAGSLRQLLCWLLLAASHVMTINFMVLPDFALPMSDAGVKNITGIYMVDQESVGRLTHALTSLEEAIRLLGGGTTRPGAIVPGGVSRLPDEDDISRCRALVAGCEDDLQETMRLAEMLTRRESRMMETGSPLTGYYMASTTDGRPALIGEEVTAAPFAGGDEVTMDPEGFLASIEERPVPWSYLVPLAWKGWSPPWWGLLPGSTWASAKTRPRLPSSADAPPSNGSIHWTGSTSSWSRSPLRRYGGGRRPATCWTAGKTAMRSRPRPFNCPRPTALPS